MDSNLLIIVTSIIAFAFIASALPTVFENVLAQEGAITSHGSVNETISGQNASQWATNATLVFAQENTGMTQGQENETSLIEGQQSSEVKNDGNNEEEEGDDE